MKIPVTADGSEAALDAVRHAPSLRCEDLLASFILATMQEAAYVHKMIRPPDASVFKEIHHVQANSCCCGWQFDIQ